MLTEVLNLNGNITKTGTCCEPSTSSLCGSFDSNTSPPPDFPQSPIDFNDSGIGHSIIKNERPMSPSIFIDCNMEQIHSIYFSNANKDQQQSSLLSNSIDPLAGPIGKLTKDKAVETSDIFEKCNKSTQIQPNDGISTCSVSNSDSYLHFTENEMSKLAQRLKMDECDLYQIIYEIREEYNADDIGEETELEKIEHFLEETVGYSDPLFSQVPDDLSIFDTFS